METKDLITPEEIDQVLDTVTDNFDGDDDVEIYDDYNDDELDDEEIEEYYDGEDSEEELEVYDDYDGDDEFVDYDEDYSGKKISEEQLRKSTRRVTFIIENTTDKQINLALNPGALKIARAVQVKKDNNGNLYYESLGGAHLPAPDGYKEGDILIMYNDPKELKQIGINVDAVLDDGIVYAESATKYVKVTPGRPESRARFWLDYIKTNPQLISAIHITSSDPSFFDSHIEIKKYTPDYIYGEEKIPFHDAFKSENYNTKKIVVKKLFRFDSNTIAVLAIPAGITATMTFVVGAEVNLGKGMFAKVLKKIKGVVRKRKIKIIRRRRRGRPLRRRKRVRRRKIARRK